jgi:hypothetical protein
MLGVRVEISRYADAAQPGWVECRLVDALGHEHVFVEKVPVVTEAHLVAASGFPQAGFIAVSIDDGFAFFHRFPNRSIDEVDIIGRIPVLADFIKETMANLGLM